MNPPSPASPAPRATSLPLAGPSRRQMLKGAAVAAPYLLGVPRPLKGMGAVPPTDDPDVLQTLVAHYLETERWEDALAPAGALSRLFPEEPWAAQLMSDLERRALEAR